MMRAFFRSMILAASAVCIIVLLASCAALSGTDGGDPSLSMGEFCGYISDGDYQAAFAFAGCAADAGVSASDAESRLADSLMIMTAKSVSVELLSEPEIRWRSAWQSAEITHLDLRMVVGKLLAGVMDETSDYEWEHGSYKNDEEISDAVLASLLRQLDGDFSDCVITEKVRIEYRYRDGRWTPVISDALYNALTGYVSEASQSVDEFFTRYRSDNSRSDSSES